MHQIPAKMDFRVISGEKVAIPVPLCYDPVIFFRGEVVCVKRCIVLSGVIGRK